METLINPGELIRVRTAAELLKKTPSWVYSLIRERVLAAVYIDDTPFLRRSEVDEYKRQKESQTPAAA